MNKRSALIALLCLVLAACSPVQEITPLPSPEIVESAVPTIGVTVPSTATVSPSETTAPALSTSETPQATPDRSQSSAVMIDHQSLDAFAALPEDVIAQAAALRVMYRHASVGENISLGLDCLWGNYPGRRPNSCQDFFDLKYDRSQWAFQFRGNPSWIEKVDDFVAQTEAQIDQFDVFMFSEDYVDGIDNPNFPAISDPENFQKYFVEPFEALEAAHPDKTFVLWSMSLARLGYANTTQFNELMRAYALENNKIMIDIADIESHDPQGNLITDENGNPIIFEGYTDESKAGHLNEAGRERLAKAFWVTMAAVVGYDPQP